MFMCSPTSAHKKTVNNAALVASPSTATTANKY